MIGFLKKHKYELALLFLVLSYIVYFTTASFLRFDNFYTGKFDLGNMDQTVWNTVNGRIFQSSNSNQEIISRLSAHADFMLIFLSPLYLIWSHPKMLLLVQSVVLGLGAIFVFLITKDVLKNRFIALVLSSLFLMSPAVQFVNLYDFHAVAFSTTTLLGAFYFLIKRRYTLMVLFLLFSVISKEQIWIISAFFGIYLLFKGVKKIKLLGILISIISIILFVFLVWYAIPQARGDREHFALSYYSDFGETPGSVVKNVFLSPQKIIYTIAEKDRLDYLRQIFMPLGFLSLLSPLHLVFASPNLFINLLSSNSNLHQIYYQYTSTITPFLFVSAIYGIKNLKKWIPSLPNYIIISYLILMTLLAAYEYGPLPGAKKPNNAMFKPAANKDIINEYLSRIPEDSIVSSTNNLGAHLSHRQILTTIPDGMTTADYVVFLYSKKEEKYVEQIENDTNYTKIFEKDNFAVFRKFSD